MKRGFTLIELLIVVAIIAILVTIVTMAAKGSLSGARDNRANAMRSVLEQGIAAYYAQEGKWPDAIETAADGMDGDDMTFSDTDADKIFQQVVGKGFGKSGSVSVLLDATGLFVCESSNCGNGNHGCNDNHTDRKRSDYCGDAKCRTGVDFSEAVRKDGKRHIPISGMAFGYAGKKEGRFRRFHIHYNNKSDRVTVTK